MRIFTPGLTFLLWGIPYLLVPTLLPVYAITRLLNWYFDVSMPSWIPILSWISYFLIYFWVRYCIRLKEDRDIHALGAARVPNYKGELPGNLELILDRLRKREQGYPYEHLDPFIREYGKIYNMNILGQNKIVTTDPNHMKAILSTDFATWEKGDKFRGQMASVLGSGVFASDGEMWKFHRSMSRPFFSRDRISDFEIFGRHADEAISAIRARRANPIDFQDVLYRFTLDSATEFLLGTCVHSLCAIVPDPAGASEKLGQISLAAETFGPALRRVQHRLAQRGRMSPLWPLLEIFGDRTSTDMKTIRAFINPIIEEALQRKKTLKQGLHNVEDFAASERQTLLDQLTDLSDDPKLIFDETLNILIAGRDTTAATTTFLVYLLALHPHVLLRLREEVLTRVGPSRYPDFDDLRELKYMRAVINETLRLFPAVPANLRSNKKATTLPSSVPGGKPHYIPANSQVLYMVLAMQRDKDVWGPDADIFDPDRFLDERLHKYVVSSPFNFIPFNAGPRICLGQQFAYNEMSFFLVRFLQVFDRMELAPDAQPADSIPPAAWAFGEGRKAVERIIPMHELTISIQGGLWMRFGEAATET